MVEVFILLLALLIYLGAGMGVVIACEAKAGRQTTGNEVLCVLLWPLVVVAAVVAKLLERKKP